ncbi:MAG TPA: hypothetical protein VNJ71_13515 [Gemmatimonadales bacterium]|jgi:hypothetical protein|nr:hypothetical protein [Gemmatimonadales bacterium]
MSVRVSRKFRYGNLSITIPTCTLPSKCPYISYVIHRPNIMDYTDLAKLESQLRDELERLKRHLAAAGDDVSVELTAETAEEHDALQRAMERIAKPEA